MKNLIETPPRTMMEVFKLLPEGTLAELIDNQIYMSPSPVFNHQHVSKAILKELFRKVEDKGLGQILFAPYDVYLDEDRNAVQPDIIVVLKENLKIIDEKGHIHGVPDLLVEILSPRNKQHDLILKKDLYERFGVKEYWIVEPDSKLAMIYALENGKYKLAGEDIGVIHSIILNDSIPF
jgi:Uma2 family endonuclease